MDLGLKDKVIIVSGGAKGIGESIVKVLAAEGVIPVIIDRNENDNLKTVNEINTSGGKCFQIVTELTDPDACEKSIQQIIKRFGAIQGLVNNAGVNDVVELEHGNYEAFTSSLHKNLIHYFLLAHYALPELKKTKGSIVNISSKTAGTSRENKSVYATGSGGKNALTREWAVELLEYGIRVNAVVINSKNRLDNRITTAEEIANTVAFLLSEKSSHTTGQLIHVNDDYVHSDPVLSNE
jgi:L-fucose dehydrogenase